MDQKKHRSSIRPVTADEHLFRCYGAVLFENLEEDLDSYMIAVQLLREFGAVPPEKYLDFPGLDQSREAFNISARFLSEMMEPKRLNLFRKISTFISLRYLMQAEIEVPGCLMDNVERVRYVSDNLGISLDEAVKIFIDEYAKASGQDNGSSRSVT